MRTTHDLSGFGRNWRCLLLAAIVVSSSALGAAPQDQTQAIPPEEYPIYDLIIHEKFLTSLTVLVMIDRMTVTKLGPEENSPTRTFFEEQRFFDGALPADIMADFILKSRQPWRLESLFNIGVRYRFVSGGAMEEPEVSLAPIPAARRLSTKFLRFDPTRIGVLKFSRVGFNRRENEALAYIGDHRPDGSGAGFLIFLRRAGQNWEIVSTEVLWIAQETE
jgi:hypothetical protein